MRLVWLLLILGAALAALLAVSADTSTFRASAPVDHSPAAPASPAPSVRPSVLRDVFGPVGAAVPATGSILSTTLSRQRLREAGCSLLPARPERVTASQFLWLVQQCQPRE